MEGSITLLEILSSEFAGPSLIIEDDELTNWVVSCLLLNIITLLNVIYTLKTYYF